MHEYRFQFVIDSLMNAMEFLMHRWNELTVVRQDIERKMENTQAALQETQRNIIFLKHQRGSFNGLVSVKALNQCSCRIDAFCVRYENLSSRYGTLQASHGKVTANARHLCNEIHGLQRRLNQFKAQKNIAMQRWRNEQSAVIRAMEREFLEQYPFRGSGI